MRLGDGRNVAERIHQMNDQNAPYTFTKYQSEVGIRVGVDGNYAKYLCNISMFWRRRRDSNPLFSAFEIRDNFRHTPRINKDFLAALARNRP